ncbi:MAG TPA: tyrosine-type recombinase/integrase [Edaphobacter sp.]|nr:tyrosine-type recombinase/integrase [Edaphobacter sp.]
MSKPVAAQSFAVLLQRFFTEHLQQHRAVSPRTVVAYRDTFRLLLSYAEKALRREPQHFLLTDLNAKFILGFLDYLETERKNSSRSRNARLAAVRSFLKYAAHHDLSALDCIQHALAVPMKRFDRPLPEFLSREEIQAILDAPDTRTWCGQRDRALLITLYNTGARVSEVLGLTAKDLILEETPAIHIHGKGRKQRSVPLWRSTASLLRSWKRRLNILGTHDYLFPNRRGTAMTRSNAAQRLSLAVAQAARNHPRLKTHTVSPHSIRHYLPFLIMSCNSATTALLLAKA